MKRYDINSIEAIQDFFRDIINIHNCLLHPDDSFVGMVDKEGGPTFKNDDAVYLDKVMNTCFAFCERHGLDIYGIAGDVQVREYKRLGLLPEDFGAMAGED